MDDRREKSEPLDAMTKVRDAPYDPLILVYLK